MMKPPRIIDIAAANADPTVILATVFTRRWIVRESMTKADGTSNTNFGQGFIIQAADNSSNPPTYGPVEERPAPQTTNDPGTFPEYAFPDPYDASFHGEQGIPVAAGPGVVVGVGVTNALPLCKIQSLTNTATSVAVTEIY